MPDSFRHIVREIETVDEPQNAGAVGAAFVAAAGLGIINKLSDAKRMVEVDQRYSPDLRNKMIYDRYFEVFKALYKNNRLNFRKLNEHIIADKGERIHVK